MEKSHENFIIRVMNKGLERAAESFSKMMAVSVKNGKIESVRDTLDKSILTADESEKLYVLITQVIGEVTGKSYLVFNAEDNQALLALKGYNTKNEMLRASLLLEVDNILSAAVIGELSNALKVEIYGDVPVLKKISAKDFQTLIKSDCDHDTVSENVFVSTVFYFTNYALRPKFIWRLNAKIANSIPEEKISHNSKS